MLYWNKCVFSINNVALLLIKDIIIASNYK
jgi:hypothetical protein